MSLQFLNIGRIMFGFIIRSRLQGTHDCWPRHAWILEWLPSIQCLCHAQPKPLASLSLLSDSRPVNERSKERTEVPQRVWSLGWRTSLRALWLAHAVHQGTYGRWLSSCWRMLAPFFLRRCLYRGYFLRRNR